jgi:hypothetical protein
VAKLIDELDALLEKCNHVKPNALAAKRWKGKFPEWISSPHTARSLVPYPVAAKYDPTSDRYALDEGFAPYLEDGTDLRNATLIKLTQQAMSGMQDALIFDRYSLFSQP